MAKATEIDIELPAASAIALGATSYDFNALHDGAVHAGSLKTEKGRDEALANAEKDARRAPMPGEAQALPPGTIIEKVDDANGHKVEVPVNDPDNQPSDTAGDDANPNPSDAG